MTKFKYNIDIIREELAKEKYILLSDKYEGQEAKLDFICPKGHKYKIAFHQWRKGKRCQFCSNHHKYTIEYVKDLFEKEGYALKNKTYKNTKDKLGYVCNLGHSGAISLEQWHRGQRCRQCGILRRNGKNSLDIDAVKTELKKKGFELLGNKYENAFKRLRVKCSNGHISYKRWNDIQQGYGCKRCYIERKVSLAETEILGLLKKHFDEIVTNSRSIIYPKELDMYIPAKKIAIEYCGIYWHSEEAGKDRKYHLNKLDKCNKKGIKLITIFEDEWVNKKDIVKSMLLNKLGISNNKIFARECTLREINSNMKDEFLDRNHIQGTDRSFVRLGAFYKDKLVSVMTFSKLNIAKGSTHNKETVELSRFCSDRDYSIVGIASKLLNFFIKNYDYKKIVSYADRRWSEGNLYKMLGFEFIHNTEPNYWYVQKTKRMHRFNFRKSVLHKKLDKFDPYLSESENMKLNGFNKIWDCGNMKFILESR